MQLSTTPKQFSQSPWRFLWFYAQKNWLLCSIILLCCFGSAALNRSVPYLCSRLVTLFSQSTEFSIIKSDMYLLLSAILGATILVQLFQSAFLILTETIFRPKVYQQIGEDSFRYINNHSLKYFSDNLAGAIADKCCELSMAAWFYISAGYYLVDIFKVLVTLGLLCTVNLTYTCIFTLFLIISILLLIKLGKLSIGLRAEMAEMRNQVTGNCIDTMQNNIFVKIFTNFHHESHRIKKQLNALTKITAQSTSAEILQVFGENLYLNFITLGFLFYGLLLWKNATIDTADFVLIFMLLRSFADSIGFMIHRGIVYSGVLSEMRTNLLPLSAPHEIQDIPNAPKLQITSGEINFNNVQFGYHKHKALFKKFNLTIPAGQKVGIVGMSGGGKSSLINILQRFYDLQGGEITIDGQNIAHVTQNSLHQAIGYVPQTSALLEQSIAANIAYARPTASQAEIQQAAKDSFSDEFIEKLPFGYQTILNAQNKLSGGQTQRLAIARVLLKNAKILILDEATSALDSESEFYIQQAIEKLIQNKTVIAIAHRLSTLKNMDRILVLEKGKIVEDGSPEELLRKKGKFYQYRKLQSLKEQEHAN